MMPVSYMIFWSIVMIAAIGLWRLRQWRDLVLVTAVTGLILSLSYALFLQLAGAADLDPDMALSTPSVYFRQGLFGWLALVVMPCGWLGPIIGLNLVQRLNQTRRI